MGGHSSFRFGLDTVKTLVCKGALALCHCNSCKMFQEGPQLKVDFQYGSLQMLNQVAEILLSWAYGWMQLYKNYTEYTAEGVEWLATFVCSSRFVVFSQELSKLDDF